MIINEEKLKQLHLFKGKEVPTKIFKIDWENLPEFVSNNYVVIEKLVQKVDGHYYYFYIIQCRRCFELKKIYSCDWKNQRIRRCIKCLSEDKRELHIGYENNTYKVLDVDIEKSNNNRRYIYYKTLCKNCGSISSLRWDSIKKDTKHGKCFRCIGNKHIPNNNALFNISYNRYRQNAISKNFNFDLTREEFINIVTQNCHYCNAEPIEIKSLKRYNKTGTPIYMNGVDRINSKEGYSIDNCVPCCAVCNRMKLNYDINFFYDHIEKIYNYHKSLTTISKESTLQANGSGSGEHPVKDDDIV